MAIDGVQPGVCLVDAPPTSDEQFALLLAEERSLLDDDPHELTADGVLDFLAQVQAQQARLAAMEADGLAAFVGAYARRREVTVLDPESDAQRVLMIEDEACEEVAAALRRSPTQVRSQAADARLLAGPLARTRVSLARGQISAGHARVIVAAARRLSTAPAAWGDPASDTPAQARDRAAFAVACRRLEKRVLARAARVTVARTALLARRAVAAIDVAGQEEQRRRARASIDVAVWPEDDGLAVLQARMPVLDAARAWAALDAHARAAGGDCAATLGQLRAAALVDALCGPSDASAAVTAAIGVTVPLGSLLGVSDDPGTVRLGTGAPQPVDAEAIRELLRDPDAPATLRRLVTDPVSGQLLDRGRRAYAVDGALRAFVVLRDGVCRFPGCLRAASTCQVDHANAWSDGGRSDRDNLGPLCTRHHQLKTHASWEITRSNPDGSCTWRSPLGRVYPWFPLGPLGDLAADSVDQPPTVPERETDPPPF